MKSTVIMEAEGANTFLRTLDSVVEVEDTENVDEFDNEILEGVRKSIGKYEFIVCHLRTIDEYLHQGKNLREMRERLEEILKRIHSLGREGDYVTILTGDHKAHGDVMEGSDYLPLILMNPGKYES